MQEQKAWHYSRLLNSPHITPNHISIIDNMMVHNFARFEKRDVKKKSGFLDSLKNKNNSSLKPK